MSDHNILDHHTVVRDSIHHVNITHALIISGSITCLVHAQSHAAVNCACLLFLQDMQPVKVRKMLSPLVLIQ